ncbi:hypothetical protein [Streptomyces sp. CBMA152]|uniref:hypothetical protein n=1 Tax=Streptomyces sp. CBMA152 TaxID=1896312 RepID=UPI001660D3AD|nr:hypothetical protein [Streptomyces sp. CBMA152]MBD0741671.1 hypothetical protein [Streptomyces sp. CBMA152]
MPDIGLPQYQDAVHHILSHARALLDGAGAQEYLRFADLLTRAAHQLHTEGSLDLDTYGLAHAVAEAAGQLVVCTRIPLQKGDPNLQYLLASLDRLPRPARIGLLTAAALRTTPHLDGNTPPPVPVPHQPSLARLQTTRPCPCVCNSGGFCGGCGHAGCAGRK